MSLRWRFTLLTTGLLAAVLVAMGYWIVRSEKALAREEVGRRLDEWTRRSLPEELPFTPRGPGLDEAALGGEPLRTELPEGPADVPIQVEWFVRERRIVICTNATEPVDTGAPPPPREGPRAAPPPVSERSWGGRHYFVREYAANETFELRDGRVVRAPRHRVGRRPPPGSRRGPRGGRGGRGPGGRPPPPPRDDDAPAVRSVGLRMRIVAEADPLLAYVGYDGRVRVFLLTGLGALAVGALFSWVASGAMVRPIGRAARAAESIRQLRQRLPEPGSKDELGRLVLVLNAMLGRLEHGAQRERQFLGTASHELRRPLAALTAELELAKRGERTAGDLHAAIDLALGDARNMSRLVDDFLAHARARAGALTMHETEVDLVELVTDSVGRCARIVGPDARLEIGSLGAFVVRGDRDALGRVVENLVLNGATHGGDGVTVTVRCERGPGGFSLFVEDDGPGISEPDLGRIFDAFGRGDTAQSRSGAGLGLAIVRDLVEAHGGTVEVDSPLTTNGAGRGTRFTVTLPAERVVSAA